MSGKTASTRRWLLSLSMLGMLGLFPGVSLLAVTPVGTVAPTVTTVQFAA
jgi:hypothetical protein